MPKRFCCVDQDDVQVAGDAAMLERIVEDDELCRQLLDRERRRRDPIGVLHMRHVRQLFLELSGFVVRPHRLRPRTHG